MGGITTKKKYIRFPAILALICLLTIFLTIPAFAITEEEVEAQVSAVGKETVTGNVLIWFLCAVAFLKVSQKVDSFMASLGVNVGHTGGSMLAEAMLATRGITMISGAFGGSSGGRRAGAPSSGGASGSSGAFGFLKGGLAGVVSRKVTNDAVKTATTATSAAHSAKSTTSSSAVHNATAASRSTQSASSVHKSGQSVHTSAVQAKAVSRTQHTSDSVTRAGRALSAFKGVGLGGAIFARSLMSGGSFANDVIGTVARGDIHSTGMITGELAAQALQSYTGYPVGEGASDAPIFSNVEIGGGRITGMVSKPGMSEPIAFGMYHADQYMEPKGDFSKVRSADGALWYTQLAQDSVERKPYKAPDDTVAYQESIIKRLPDPPKRKDRI